MQARGERAAGKGAAVYRHHIDMVLGGALEQTGCHFPILLRRVGHEYGVHAFQRQQAKHLGVNRVLAGNQADVRKRQVQGVDLITRRSPGMALAHVQLGLRAPYSVTVDQQRRMLQFSVPAQPRETAGNASVPADPGDGSHGLLRLAGVSRGRRSFQVGAKQFGQHNQLCPTAGGLLYVLQRGP